MYCNYTNMHSPKEQSICGYGELLPWPPRFDSYGDLWVTDGEQRESGKKYYYAPEKFHIVGEDICACKWED